MIAIKDMEMPKSCAECLFMSYSECLLNDEYIMDTAERDNDCPLKEIVTCKDCKHWDKVIKEIEESKESVVGRYDVNTPEWERPYAKTMRNNGRKEALEIIKKHLREVEE